MAFNSVFSWIMKKRVHQIELFQKYPLDVQDEVLHNLLEHGRQTTFGLEHDLDKVHSWQDFKKAVPVREYPDMKGFIDRVQDGEEHVLWSSKVRWFAKSSGTTASKSKYIPVTREALEDCHYKAGKDMLALYCAQVPDARLYSGKHLVVGGTAPLNARRWDRYSGDLSAIIIKNLPIWAELKRVPSREIALLDDWEEKIERMARATAYDDVGILTGVPSWTLVLIKRVLEITGKSDLREVWPHLELFIHGGVSFKPYRDQFDRLISGEMHYLETYNASEGFFGIQDRLHADDLLLMLDYGIYYEFIPMSEMGKDDPETISLKDVEVGKNYALVISTNGGLWRYLIGDTVRFTSTRPYRIQVSGRTRHFINVFGEEVIVENADSAVRAACDATDAMITDYTVGPVFMDGSSTGGHEWLIEFEQNPQCLKRFTEVLDSHLKAINTDYSAKRSYDMVLQPPRVHAVPNGTFYNWMKGRGKLGGQHKVPRLSNDREFVDQLLGMVVQA